MSLLDGVSYLSCFDAVSVEIPQIFRDRKQCHCCNFGAFQMVEFVLGQNVVDRVWTLKPELLLNGDRSLSDSGAELALPSAAIRICRNSLKSSSDFSCGRTCTTESREVSMQPVRGSPPVLRPVPFHVGAQILNFIFQCLNLNRFFSKPHWMSPRISMTNNCRQSLFWFD